MLDDFMLDVVLAGIGGFRVEEFVGGFAVMVSARHG
jgi:hypothetical protein